VLILAAAAAARISTGRIAFIGALLEVERG
jgi:hypothetical protein